MLILITMIMLTWQLLRFRNDIKYYLMCLFTDLDRSYFKFVNEAIVLKNERFCK
jgi:hypothetical protein